jgi:hypothetical protein
MSRVGTFVVERNCGCEGTNCAGWPWTSGPHISQPTFLKDENPGCNAATWGGGMFWMTPALGTAAPLISEPRHEVDEDVVSHQAYADTHGDRGPSPVH